MMAPFAHHRRSIPADARIDHVTLGDGWRLRRFRWPAAAPSRGSILFQGGRGDIVEKYLELLAQWHDGGWDITSFDWRGQGGSGRLTDNPRCGHIDDFGRYIEDYAAFFADWAGQTPGPHVVIGHSMGGHLVLRALVERRARPDAAVLVAPMLGLHSPFGARPGEAIARLMTRIGNPARLAWKGNERPATMMSRQQLLTFDPDRYQDELWWRQLSPELVVGPPSWQWVAEAFESTRRLRADPRLATLTVPVLMLVADADKLVLPSAALAIGAKLPDAAIVRFGPESAHEILREADGVRNRAIAAIDSFLDTRAPAAP